MNSGENLPNIVKQYVERSSKTFEDAKILANNRSWNSCVNRLYYACFYMVYAVLLQKEDVRTKTHSDIKTLFSKFIVKPGLIATEWSSFYSFLMDKRTEADYEDFGETTEDEVTALLPQAEEFINTVKKLIV